MQNTFSFILGVIVVLVVAAGGFWYFGKKDAAPARPSENGAVEQNMPELNSPQTPEMVVTGTEASPDASVSPSAEAPNQVPQVATITYTDGGFSPKTIEIKVGETVKFANESSRSMWVASAPHPTHTNYPEFDQKTAVDKGTSYEFTFTKAGTWKYHNHKSTSDSGTVVVK